MKMTAKQQQVAAKLFAKTWKGKGYEKGEAQPFWLALLRSVYGVENPESYISFENRVKLSRTSFIDGMIPATKVLIEQKGINIDLKAPIQQSSGEYLKPYEQAIRYRGQLPYSDQPRWIVICNFQEFHVYNMENPSGEPQIIRLEDLEKEYYRLNFLVDTTAEEILFEKEVSLQAGEIVGQLYDEFLKQYHNPDDPSSLQSLNMLCVRLVFCLYAEDAGVFGRKGMFNQFLRRYEARDMRQAIIRLFDVLDTKPEDRDPYMDDELAAFPYVNGGLFQERDVEIPRFTEEIVDLLLTKASRDFDWSRISPTIFGAVFESTLNPETRRAGGMHYTSIENIHKVIDPLFMDPLKEEFDEIRNEKVYKKRHQRLIEFHRKLSSLKILDPACGSGNFLTESYLSLRKLENEILRFIYQKDAAQIIFGIDQYEPIKVNVEQFYGIEINDFAATVATTALWIAESQMMDETEGIVHQNLDFLPLHSYPNVVQANALRLDWETIVSKQDLNYIIGNPPFVGARLMNREQKADLQTAFPNWKNVGNLDYVAGWFKKAADLMENTKIRTAFVATNSISQGELVATLWKPLFERGVQIDFAHLTFKWDSEATQKANVHVVIIGFSMESSKRKRVIYSGNNPRVVSNINAYLVDAENVFVSSRSKPISDVPSIGIGNKPIDNTNYLFKKDEMIEFIAKEPDSEKLFKKFYGAYEFINRKPRYCLWLGDCTPDELKKMPNALNRVEAVRQFRLESKSPGTVKLADRPTRFHVENMPSDSYILIPRVSSERRPYIPMGFMTPDELTSDSVLIMPNANIYHLGVLTSNVHMAWMRTVAGRLKSDYRYSKDIVYNNFIWPDPTPEQKAKIEKTAQGILDARELYPDSSLAVLYDEVTMPIELRRAHRFNDAAVMEAYGFDHRTMTESECVAELMKLYQRKIADQENS